MLSRSILTKLNLDRWITKLLREKLPVLTHFIAMEVSSSDWWPRAPIQTNESHWSQETRLITNS